MKHSPLISLICSIAALLISIFILLKPNPLGKGIKAYDISTPEKALKAQIQIRLNKDYLAAVQYRSNRDKEKAEEIESSLEIHDSEDYDGKKILFISYTEDGEKKYDTEGFEKDSESGLWYRAYISTYDMPDNSEMKKRIQKWKAKSE